MDWRTCWTIVIVGGLTCVSCGREIPSAKKEQNSPSRSIAVSGNSDAAAPRTATQFNDFQVPPVFLKVRGHRRDRTCGTGECDRRILSADQLRRFMRAD